MNLKFIALVAADTDEILFPLWPAQKKLEELNYEVS